MRSRLVLPLAASLAACVQAEPSEEPDRYQLDIAENLYADASNLDLGDLVWGTGRLATDGVNSALRGIPYGDSRLSYTQLFGLEETAADDLTIRGLPEIATGLATRFGENTLPAQVAAIRRRHLETSDDELYAETGFRLGARFDHGFGQSVPGLVEDEDGWIGVGFDAGVDVQARVVSAHRSEIEAVRRTPLTAIGNLRGFVVPRDVDDLRERMKPGESLALSGHGQLGLNFGVGVPLLVANPVESVTYSIVLSAGASTRLSGELDVQIVRLEGDEAILDVGLRNARVERAYVRVDDSFGISGLVRSHVRIGPFDLDLGRIAQRALEREINRRLSLISARAEGSRESLRESVARFRIDLARVGQPGRVAIEQAFKGDIRLAQALAARRQDGLTAEVDLMRAGRTTYGHLGLDLLGMRFFTETERQEGEAILQTPGGSLAVMFDSLRHESGSWFSEHGYARSVLAGVEVGPDGVPRSQANLYLTWKDGDDYMQRDTMLDHLDALLYLVLGREGQAKVSAVLDEIGRATQAKCAGMSNFDADNGRTYRACKMSVLRDPAIATKVDLAKQVLDDAIRTAAPDDAAEGLVREVFALALAAVRAYEPAASLAGPPTNIALATWLSEEALGRLMTSTNGAQLEGHLNALAVISQQDRDRTNGVERARRDLRGEQGILDAVAERYDELRQSYLDLLAIASSRVDGVGEVGDSALLIDVPVSADNRLRYDDLLVRTISRRRVEVVAEMVDDLIEDLDDVDGKPERILGPALLALLPADLRDVRADVDMNLEDNWAQDFPQYVAAGYAPLHAAVRGANVRLMGGDLTWDVARLVDLQR
jgi:hypothetical protein